MSDTGDTAAKKIEITDLHGSGITQPIHSLEKGAIKCPNYCITDLRVTEKIPWA